MSVVMNAGDRNPFFLEAGAWFTASGACEVLVDRGPTKIRQKIGATEQQVGPFLSDANILIIATAETTYTVHSAGCLCDATHRSRRESRPVGKARADHHACGDYRSARFLCENSVGLKRDTGNGSVIDPPHPQ